MGCLWRLSLLFFFSTGDDIVLTQSRRRSRGTLLCVCERERQNWNLTAAAIDWVLYMDDDERSFTLTMILDTSHHVIIHRLGGW